MRYEVLGYLRIVGPNGVSALRSHKCEVVLASLLARAGRVVPAEQLCEELWGEHPPRRATATLYVYISHLRKFLTDVQRGRAPIVTKSSGYLISTGDDELDSLEFQILVERGRMQFLAAQYEAAASSFEQAQSLWRGPALEGLSDGPIVHEHTTWLEQTRFECVDLLAESYLKLNRYREVISLLRVFTIEQPLREDFYRNLMLALHLSGRRAEALQIYDTARRQLNEELGLEPCGPLRELHHDILAGDMAAVG